jgi:hypothetical protein
MSEIVSKSETYHLTQEYEKTWKELLNLLLARIKLAGKHTNNSITVKVGRENVFQTIWGKRPTLNRLRPEYIQKVQTAFKNPSELKGTVSIFIGDEQVFQVKDGQVIKDDLQLISNAHRQNETGDIELHLGTQELKDKGNIIANCAREILNTFRGGKEVTQASDGTLCYQSGYYVFSCKEEKVTVVSKETGQVVLNNNGFTDMAREKDIKLLQKVEQAAAVVKEENKQQEEQHQQQSHQQQQSQPQFTLKMRQRAW